MKFLITGARGQLGREFVKTLESKGYEYLALSREELDISDFDKVLKTLQEYRPSLVINCSAYNFVDKAEEEFSKAFAVNTLGIYNLAVACREIGAFMVHYSTDYVFDGTKESPYTEEDKPNPLSKYALSKYFGEEALKNVLEDYLLFRTSWVYGEGTQNFLYKLEQWAKDRDVLRIAVDEFSVPTSTRTIVEVTLKALERGLRGIYHLVNSDYASRYEWAKEFFRIKGIKKFIYPAYRTDFDLPAERPKFSVMSNVKICKELGINIREWREEMGVVINVYNYKKSR